MVILSHGHYDHCGGVMEFAKINSKADIYIQQSACEDYYNIKNGYYEKKINEKTKITSENIKEFEQDIKENKYIDLKKYNQEEYIDSNNIVSKLGYKVSENINIIIKEKTKEIYNFLKKLFS